MYIKIYITFNIQKTPRTLSIIPSKYLETVKKEHNIWKFKLTDNTFSTVKAYFQIV